MTVRPVDVLAAALLLAASTPLSAEYCTSTTAVSRFRRTAQGEVIHLTKPADIRRASTVDQAIVALSNKVMECVQRKLAPASECSCLYPQELSRVRSAYERTLRQHPGWKNKVVSYTLEGRTYAVSFGGVNRQLQRQCPQGK
jgi:hypothetical protein